MLKQGWLNRQIQNASEDVKSWPSWMKREAKLEESESKERPKEISNTKAMKANQK